MQGLALHALVAQALGGDDSGDDDEKSDDEEAGDSDEEFGDNNEDVGDNDDNDHVEVRRNYTCSCFHRPMVLIVNVLSSKQPHTPHYLVFKATIKYVYIRSVV